MAIFTNAAQPCQGSEVPHLCHRTVVPLVLFFCYRARFFVTMLKPSGKLASTMACLSCRSTNQTFFPAEINIHHPGMDGLDKPALWAFPSLLMCLDCGYTRFTLPDDQLRELTESESSADATAA